MSEPIAMDDFLAVDIRSGRVTAAEPFAKARSPAYKLWIDFGADIGERKSSAQVTELYSAAQLVGREVLAVVNFPPRQIADFMSDVLVLGIRTKDGVVLVGPDRSVPTGSRLA